MKKFNVLGLIAMTLTACASAENDRLDVDPNFVEQERSYTREQLQSPSTDYLEKEKNYTKKQSSKVDSRYAEQEQQYTREQIKLQGVDAFLEQEKQYMREFCAKNKNAC